MKKIIEWVKVRGKIFKRLFLAAVLLIVVTQLVSISRRISGEDVRAILADLDWWKPVLMIFIGIVGVFPMVFYDIILHRLIEKKEKLWYILETSWLINTMNNVIGFGGVFSFGLRGQFYAKKGEEKKTFQAISKIFLFTMSGLSFLSLLTFFAVTVGQVSDFVGQYWFWLLVGALYFPVVLVATSLKKEGLLGGIKTSFRLALFGTSLLEWLGVTFTFLLIGLLMGLHLPVVEVSILFIASMVIGIISMIPGALGSFDVMMLMGLDYLGISNDKTVAWLLLFRIAYYFIPFLVGIIFGAKNLGGKFNEEYHGVPLNLLREILHKLVTYLLYLTGILTVLSATVPEVVASIRFLRRISPFSMRIILEFPQLLLGFLLIIVGRAFANRTKRAYIPTLLMEFITLIYLTFIDYSGYSILFFVLLILLTIVAKPELYRKQLVMSKETLFKDGFIYFLLIVFYAGIGVYNSPQLPHKHKLNEFFLFPSEKMWLTGFIAILLVNVIGFIFIHYLEGKKIKIGEKVEEDRVKNVLESYGGNTQSHLVFLGDKEMFMYQNKEGEDTCFLQFQTYNDKVLVMGNPSGKEEDFVPCVYQFIELCDTWGYAPVFYEVQENLAMMLHEIGFNFIKMGEEGHVDMHAFSLTGKRSRGLRATINKFEREGYQFELLETPIKQTTLQRLKTISEEWLGDRKEKGFSLGFYSESYIEKAPVAVVRDTENQIVAFATIMPSYTDEVVSIDLMRFSHQAPKGVMDYLFISLFECYKEKGYQSFDLGMAPLSNVGTSRKSFIQERMANLVYQFGNKFYSFQGLRGYKEKYADFWVSRYTLYPRDNSILFVIYSLILVDNKSVGGTKDSQKSCK